MRSLGYVIAALALAAPAQARDSLGVFGGWAAFRDPEVPRCYAIAQAIPSTRTAEFKSYVTVATWPKRGLRGQIQFRLSRKLASGSKISLTIGDKSFALTGGANNAWARDRSMDAAIVAAMRSASRMTVRAKTEAGQEIINSFDLGGAATAMDAATVSCASIK